MLKEIMGLLIMGGLVGIVAVIQDRFTKWERQ